MRNQSKQGLLVVSQLWVAVEWHEESKQAGSPGREPIVGGSGEAHLLGLVLGVMLAVPVMRSQSLASRNHRKQESY